MGAVDLVIQIESPPSVASALQRVGRAGHQVGEVSRGVLFPKHRGDLRPDRGRRRADAHRAPSSRCGSRPTRSTCSPSRSSRPPRSTPGRVDDLFELCPPQRAVHPPAALARTTPRSTCSAAATRPTSSPSCGPRIVWDRVTGTLTGRPGAQRLAVTSGGTIPDRGLFGVFLVGARGPGERVGELDEEMVYESRVGDVFALGATSWRIEDITHDRVLVTPAPGIPGRLPFWKGDTLGRPAELGAAIGAFTRELGALPDGEGRRRGPASTASTSRPPPTWSATSPSRSRPPGPAQRPHAARRAVPRRARRLAAGRPLPLRHPGARALGAGHQRPAARAVRRRRPGGRLRRRHRGPDPRHRRRAAHRRDRRLRRPTRSTTWSPRRSAGRRCSPPASASAPPGPCCCPAATPAGARPLWQQRQRVAALLEVAVEVPVVPDRPRGRPRVPPGRLRPARLVGLMRRIDRREVQVIDVATTQPSPYARSLLFGYVAQFVYEGDSPIAERRAAALSLDQGLLAELLGRAELRELLDPEVLAEVEAELQRLAPDRRVRDAEGVADLLRLLGPLTTDGDRPRATVDGARRRAAGWPPSPTHRRVVEVRMAGERALGRRRGRRPAPRRARRARAARHPRGLRRRRSTTRSATWSPATPAPTARSPPTRSPTGSASAPPWPGTPCSGWPRRAGCSTASSGRPAPGSEWCDAEVLRKLRRRSLARLRKEVEPVEPEALGRFLPAWQHSSPAARAARGRRRAQRDRPARRVRRCRPRALESLVLPARGSATTSRRYLDELTAAGEVLWAGHGAAARAPTAGSALHLADQAHAHPARARAASSTPSSHQAVLDALAPGGAWFFRQLADAVGSPPTTPALSRRAVGPRLGRPGQQRHPRPAARAHPLRHHHPPHPPPATRAPAGSAARRTGPPETAGRWAAAAGARHRPDPARPRRRRAAARPARRRHPGRGRERAACPAGSPAVYKVLSAFEDSGRCRRGYFVDGLGAAQFGTAGADRPAAHLRRARPPTPSRPPSPWPPPTPPTRTAPRCPGPSATPSRRPPPRAQGRRDRGPGRRPPDPVRRARRPHPAHLERRRSTRSPRPPHALADAVRRGALGRLTVEKADGDAAPRRRARPRCGEAAPTPPGSVATAARG